MHKFRFISIGFSLLVTVFLVLVVSCDKQPAVSVPFDESKAVFADLSGKNAFEHVRALVNFGPRPSGSKAMEESRLYIIEELSRFGWETERQSFEQSTPEGPYTFVNLRSRFGERTGNGPVGLLCSHYDTKSFRFEFVGANDAGSSTGLLIEMARVLAQRPEIASKIELVFFDGEEAFGTNITDTDGLYGSRYYAKQLAELPVLDRPQWGVLLDMVGDKDLNIEASVRFAGDPTLLKQQFLLPKSHQFKSADVANRLNAIGKSLLSAATDLDVRSQVGLTPDYITDDHVPLNRIAGVPTIDIIDFDYGDYWHTPGDTIDKISAESLQVSGQVSLLLIEKYLFPGFNLTEQ